MQQTVQRARHGVMSGWLRWLAAICLALGAVGPAWADCGASQSLHVTSGGTAVISCANPFGFNEVGGSTVPTSHGSLDQDAHSTNYVDYTNSGDGALQDIFTLTDAETGTMTTFTVTVDPATSIIVSPGTLPVPAVGVAYSQQLSASGGTAPYTYVLSGGTIPPGLSVSSSGLISGTPTGEGTFNFTVHVTDSAAVSIDKTFSPNIPYPTLTISPASVPTGTINIAYSQQFSTSGGTAPYSYAINTGSLPPGLSLSSSGLLSGTPTATGSYTFTVESTDSTTNAIGGSGSVFNSESITLVINATPTIVIAPTSLPAATVGTTYSQTATASGGTAPYTYVIAAGALPAGLTLGASSGVIGGKPTAGGSFNFTVMATDANGFSGTRALSLTSNAPTIAVAPTTLTGAAVGMAYSASLSSTGGTSPYSYAISSGALPAGMSLSSSGVLSGTPTAGGSFNFTVTATDSSTGTGPYQGSRAYNLTVAAPTITLPATALSNGTRNTAYSATLNPATGGTAPYTYAVTGGALPAGLSLSSAGSLSGTPTATGSFNFTVTSTDSSTGTGPYTGSQSYALTVVDVVPVAQPVSDTVGYDSAAAPVTLSITGGTPDSVTVATAAAHGTASASGTTITYRPTAGFAGSDSFTYTASNTQGTSAPATVSITVSNPTIAVGASGLLSTTAGSGYTQTFSWSGGTAPYSGFSVSGLPAGLSITGSTASSVTVSGTPTQAGSFTLTTSAQDSSTGNGPFTGTQTFTLTVAAPTLALSPASGNLSLTYGTANSQVFTASGGTGPYTYAETGALPPGMSFNTATATLSGTPTAPGSYPVTVTATDSSTGSGAPFAVTSSLTLVVGTPALVIAPASLPAATLGSSYSATVTTSGGVAPYGYAMTGTLPAGITLAANGQLSGTPTAAGSFSFTVTSTDANSQTGTRAYTFIVNGAALVLSPASLPAATAETAYTQTLVASGGTAPYHYAVTTGSLPAGITLDAVTGALAGTPTASGDFTFTVTGTDSSTGTGAPFTAAQSYTLHVAAPALTLTPATMPGGTVATAYSTTLGASGGAGPYTYALTGSLPAGMSFDATTARLSGTPTAAGSFPLTASATDAHGFVVSTSYTLTINAATLILSPASLPAATAETAYAQTLVASGGTAPYHYAVTTGTLPAGLALDAGSGALAGTPTASGDFAFAVTTTDSSTGAGAPFSASRSYTLHVAAPAITLTPASLPGGKSAVAYRQTLGASGGNGSYSFALTAGTLPTGLSLAGDGTLAGTPTAAGSFTFTVTGTDGLHFSGQQNYTLSIDAAQPVAVTDAISTQANRPVTIHVTANDTGPIDRIAVVTAPTHGTASIGALDVSYTPAANFFGTDTLTYTASGPGGTSAPATVTITVQALAIPTVVAQTATTLAGKAVTIHTAAGATGGPFTALTLTGPPTQGIATISGTDIVYTPNDTAAGSENFGYVLSNAFGNSAPAAITVTINPRPHVAAQTVQMLAGTTTQVELTRGASGGPFAGAAVVAIAPANAGSAKVRASAQGYQLTFVAAANFSGVAQLSYTLSNAYATSAPGIVTLTITARPDPSRDAEVLGTLDAQVDTTRRFATAQIANFQQRLETLHSPGYAGFTSDLGFYSGSARDRRNAFDANGMPTFAGENRRYLVAPDSAQETPAAERARASQAGDLSLWAGGAVNFGSQRPGGASNGIDFTTSGVSIGADRRLSSALAVGAGIGYGHDATDIGRHGSRSTANSYNAALYASYHPTAATYLDTLAGYQWLTFDARRYVTGNGAFVGGSRDGHQAFASIALGYEHRAHALLLSPYGRLDAAAATLGAYTEHGDATAALDYQRQTVKTTTGSLGLRVEYTMQRDYGTLAPRARVEYQHDFQGTSQATMSYADLLAGPLYRARVGGQSRNHALLGLGVQLQTTKGLQLRLEYQNLLDASTHRDQSILLGLEKPLPPP